MSDGHQGAGQLQAHPPAAGEAGDLGCAARTPEAEAEDQRLGAGWRRVRRRH